MKKEQEALAAEFAATVADNDEERVEILNALKEEGLENILHPNKPYDPAGGVVPPGILRSELERLLGIRPVIDEEDPLASGVPFQEAEELIRDIEEGKATIEPPSEFWDEPPESAESFMARLDASVERFEEMLLSKKEQSKLRRQRKIAGSQEDERIEDEEFRRLLEDIPTFPEDIMKNRPAPDIPETAGNQFKRAERVLLVLRRALLEDNLRPGAALHALRAKNLVAENELTFEDPWLALQGIEDIKRYLDRLEAAGARLDLDMAFSEYYEYR